MKHLVEAIFAKLQKIFADRNIATAFLRFQDGAELRVTEMDKTYFRLCLSLPDRAYRCTINQNGAFGIDIEAYGDDESLELYRADCAKIPELRRIVAVGLDLADEYYGKVTVKELPKFPEHCNPYNYDSVRQGVPIYGAIEVMFLSNGTSSPNELVIVNTHTGKRVEIDISALS